MTRANCIAFVLSAFLVAPGSVFAEALPIFIDGFPSEWTGTVEHVDPAGDAGSSGVDFREVDVANDDDYFFVRFETTTLVLLQDSSNLVLYLDTDANSGTGLSINGIGAELEWHFGDRNGTFHTSSSTVFQNDIRLRQLPTVTATTFEIALGRDMRPDGTNLLFTGNTVRVLLRDIAGGDEAPNNGSTLTYTFDATVIGPPAPLPLDREMPTDLRIVTWNTRDLANGFNFDPGVTPSADRVLSALDPNIICFQEIYDPSANDTQALVEGFLPFGTRRVLVSGEDQRLHRRQSHGHLGKLGAERQHRRLTGHNRRDWRANVVGQRTLAVLLEQRRQNLRDRQHHVVLARRDDRGWHAGCSGRYRLRDHRRPQPRG